MERHKVAFSPHNPSGPVCHAATLHAAAAAPNLDRLEVQFDEAALFGELVREPVPPCVAGASALPAGTGIGLTLVPAVVARARVGRWSSEHAEACP
jgi:galactonate dehydratase